METRRYLMAGHSHVGAFRFQAWDGGDPRLLPLKGREEERLLGLVGGARDSRYWDKLVEEARDADVLLLWGGNEHLSRFLFAADPLFDFYLRSHPSFECEQDAILVPEMQVRALLNRGNIALPHVLKKLLEVPGCRVVVCGTPPPKGDDKRLKDLLSKEPSFVKKAHELGIKVQDVKFTPRNIRRKLWIVVQELFQEIAEAHSAEFRPVPPFAFTKDGFLANEYWADDATHANIAYGAKFLEELIPTRSIRQ